VIINLYLVPHGLDVDGFRVEFLDVEVELHVVVVCFVDAVSHGVVVQLHEEPADAAAAGRLQRRRSRCVRTAGYQPEHVAVDVGHLVGHAQPQPVHLLADVDAEVAGDAVGVVHAARVHVDVRRTAARRRRRGRGGGFRGGHRLLHDLGGRRRRTGRRKAGAGTARRRER